MTALKLVGIPGAEETYVLCRTTARQQKEKATRSRFSKKIEDALGRLEKRVREGKLKTGEKLRGKSARFKHVIRRWLIWFKSRCRKFLPTCARNGHSWNT
jgi:hypothetical protein